MTSEERELVAEFLASHRSAVTIDGSGPSSIETTTDCPETQTIGIPPSQHSTLPPSSQAHQVEACVDSLFPTFSSATINPGNTTTQQPVTTTQATNQLSFHTPMSSDQQLGHGNQQQPLDRISMNPTIYSSISSSPPNPNQLPPPTALPSISINPAYRPEPHQQVNPISPCAGPSVTPQGNMLYVGSQSAPLDALIDTKTRKLIVDNEYVDLRTLLKSPEMDDTMTLQSPELWGDASAHTLVIKPPKPKKQLDFSQWLKAMLAYTTVYGQAYPTETLNVIKHIDTVRELKSNNAQWLYYDESFRRMRKITHWPWQIQQSELWNKAHARVASDDYNTTPHQKTQHSFRPSNNQRRSGDRPTGTCFNYNEDKPCTGCKYPHQCYYCHGNHRAIFCNSKTNKPQPSPHKSTYPRSYRKPRN